MRIKILFEEYGVFNGCEKIAREIMKIVKNAKQLSFTVKMKNCDFIETMEIHLTNENGAGFNSLNSSINNNGKYDPLSLTIGMKVLDNDEDALPSIMHELLHAHQNYNLYLKNTSLYDEISKTGYFKNQANPPSMLREALYFLNKYEVGAYITSLVGDLKSTDKTFNSIEEVYKFIRKTVDYRNYQKIFQYCEAFNSLDSTEQQDVILNYANKYSGKTFKTYNQFLKWLNDKVYKVKKKFETIVPKIAYEHLQMGGFLKQPKRETVKDNLPLV